MSAPFINVEAKESCPLPEEEVNEYLLRDDPDIESCAQYLGSASFPDKTFWIWQYQTFDNEVCQVVVTKFSDGNFEIGSGQSQLEEFTLEGFAEELYRSASL